VVAACNEIACDDFGRFWYATSAWSLSGQSLYAPTPASFGDDRRFYANLNLPHTHLLFLPFTYLTRDAAAFLWFVLGLGAVVISARVLHTEVRWRPSGAWILIFIWWMPTHVQAVTGQVAWLMLPLVALGWKSARRASWTSAGIFIGLLVALKPFLVPLAAWLFWRREWRALFATFVTMGLVIAAGVQVFGLESYAQWQRVAAGVDWYAKSFNASIWGVSYRTLAPNVQFWPLADGSTWLPFVVGAGSVAIALVCWMTCRCTENLDRQWTVVLASSLLVSPLGWVYYGVWLLPGLLGKWPGAAATAAWLIPTPWLLFGQPSGLATVLWGSAATWGLVLALRHITRSR
jgi:hypothetical protein